MLASIRITSLFIVLNGLLSIATNEKTPKIVIVGAGASGISAAVKLLENGYDDIVVLEAENRIGGRVYSIPFGKGFVDLGAQWCQGEKGNIVYEMVKDNFEFVDNGIGPDNSLVFTSDGKLVDQKKFGKLMNLSISIAEGRENQEKFNKSLGEFFELNYWNGFKDKDFEDVDKELADQVIDLCQRGMNSLYASESWFDVSSKFMSSNGAEGSQQLTWKEHGFKIVFDYLTKKLPDPSKAIPVDDKIELNKEVTNIDWSSNEAVVRCADGTEYRADHVIVTVSLGFLKQHHRTLFTPQLPQKKVTAIETTGYGTLGKLFLEFENPFWPADIKEWAQYVFLWKKEDKDSLRGTKREWLTEVYGFGKQIAQPNIIGAYTAGKFIKQFEEISDEQLIDDCMWLLEKFLGRTLPRPINMRRNRWMTSKYFLGSYSYGSMKAQANNVSLHNDLGETLSSSGNKPVLLVSGEATDEFNSGYVHGAVMSGFRSASDILDYYKSNQH
ncbi:hypothetical protein HA402_013800 [Bradysia odoriphaga]|nr:hypothetical protein HA402_013800 [Bradysia odoriphaga]